MILSSCLTLIERTGSLKAYQKLEYSRFCYLKNNNRGLQHCVLPYEYLFLFRQPTSKESELSCISFFNCFYNKRLHRLLWTHKIMCVCAITIRHKGFCSFCKFRCDLIEKCSIIKYMVAASVIFCDSRIGDNLFLL